MLCKHTLMILPDVPTFAAFHFNNLFKEVGNKTQIGKIKLNLSLSHYNYKCGVFVLRVKTQNQFKYFTEKLLIIISKITNSEGAVSHIFFFS